MKHELVAVGVVLVTLGLGAQACGSSLGDPRDPTSAAAQATLVRRTAVAEVQRIVANNPTPTVAPPATATPSPTCPDAIWWTDARSHVGESRTVQGTIVGMRPAPNGAVLLEVGQPYPDPTGLAVIVPAAAAANLNGHSVCVAGRIDRVEGEPTMQVRDASSVVVVN